MSPTSDERPVEALGADGPDPPLRERVGPWRPERGTDHRDALRTEHLNRMVSTVKKSVASTPGAWLRKNCDQVGPPRLGAGVRPAALRIRLMVVASTWTTSLRSSPRIRG
jgi:hypothetical protein